MTQLSPIRFERLERLDCLECLECFECLECLERLGSSVRILGRAASTLAYFSHEKFSINTLERLLYGRAVDNTRHQVLCTQSINIQDLRRGVGQILGPGAVYFPVAGTLIGFMRYGRMVGELKDNTDVVDRDLDLYLVLPSARAFLELCVRLTTFLRRRGWLGCSLKWRQSWWSSQGEDLASASSPQDDFDFRRSFTLQCHLLSDQGDSLLEIKWLVPVFSVPKACPLNLTDALRPSYLEHKEFDAISCTGGVKLLPRNINVSSMSRNVGITTGPIYCSPDSISEDSISESCWSLANQLRKWKGVLPASMWNSRGRCRAYKGAVRCMRKSTLFLQRAGEADLYHPGKGSCLALPDLACPGDVLEWPSGRSKTPHNLRLRERGLSDADVQVLATRMLELRDAGFVTHNITDCDLRLCARDVSARRESIGKKDR